MRKLELDFASRATPLQTGAWILFGLSVLATIVLWRASVDANAEQRQIGNELNGLKVAQARAVADRALDPAALARREAEISAANAALSRIATPWDDLFAEIEGAVDEKNIALIAVEPDAEAHEISITGEARDLQSMLDYAKRIGASARFKDSYVKSHTVQVADAQKPVRFQLSAKWLPGGAGK